MLSRYADYQGFCLTKFLQASLQPAHFSGGPLSALGQNVWKPASWHQLGRVGVAESEQGDCDVITSPSGCIRTSSPGVAVKSYEGNLAKALGKNA